MSLADTVYTTIIKFSRGPTYSIVAAWNKYTSTVTFHEYNCPFIASKELGEKLMEEAEVALMKQVEKEQEEFFNNASTGAWSAGGD